MAELLQNVIEEGGTPKRIRGVDRDVDARSLYDLPEAKTGSVVKEDLALVGRPVREVQVVEEDGQLQGYGLSDGERVRSYTCYTQRLP